MNLLAAEILAVTGRDPGEHYTDLTKEFGTAYYARVDAPATPDEKTALAKLSTEAVKSKELAGEAITAKLTRAPGNDAPIGGLKVVTQKRLVWPRGRRVRKISIKSTPKVLRVNSTSIRFFQRRVRLSARRCSPKNHK